MKPACLSRAGGKHQKSEERAKLKQPGWHPIPTIGPAGVAGEHKSSSPSFRRP